MSDCKAVERRRVLSKLLCAVNTVVLHFTFMLNIFYVNQNKSFFM